MSYLLIKITKLFKNPLYCVLINSKYDLRFFCTKIKLSIYSIVYCLNLTDMITPINKLVTCRTFLYRFYFNLSSLNYLHENTFMNTYTKLSPRCYRIPVVSKLFVTTAPFQKKSNLGASPPPFS